MSGPKNWLNHWLRALRSDRRGVTALEYGIVAGWLAFVIVIAFQNLGSSIAPIFTKVGTSI